MAPNNIKINNLKNPPSITIFLAATGSTGFFRPGRAATVHLNQTSVISRASSRTIRAMRLESNCGPLVHIFAILTLF